MTKIKVRQRRFTLKKPSATYYAKKTKSATAIPVLT